MSDTNLEQLPWQAGCRRFPAQSAGRPERVARHFRRIFQLAAGFVSRGRVVAKTDCGFGTFARYGKIDPGVGWKKLRIGRDGADLADSRL